MLHGWKHSKKVTSKNTCRCWLPGKEPCSPQPWCRCQHWTCRSASTSPPGDNTRRLLLMKAPLFIEWKNKQKRSHTFHVSGLLQTRKSTNLVLWPSCSHKAQLAWMRAPKQQSYKQNLKLTGPFRQTSFYTGFRNHKEYSFMQSPQLLSSQIAAAKINGYA